jgi:hypothetical protein
MNTITHRKALSAYLTASIMLTATVPLLGAANPSSSHSTVPAEARQKLAKLQIPFIANQGQGDKEMKFYARTFAGTVFVTETGKLVYSLPKMEGKAQVKGVVLEEELVGGKVTEVKGENQAITKLNYFRGNERSKWQRNIPSYDVVSLGEVYGGIEVKLKAYGNNVEKLFYIKPGGEPQSIKLKLSGGRGTKVNENGEVEVETEEGTVTFSKPVAFQESGGKKELVQAAYVVHGNEYGLSVENYDRTRELVIDPILAATFVGGSNLESVHAIVLDSTGNVYVAGDTESPDFPGIGPGSADSTLSGIQPSFVPADGFVVKLNSDLTSILAATFLGGGAVDQPSGPIPIDQARALALDSTGNVYVAGLTNSPDFPGVGPGSADSTHAGSEGFVAKLNSDLSSILAATFLGGSSFDRANALALDSRGSVYVAGETASTDFPGIGPRSADRTFLDGEAFVAKLNSDLTSILAATFLGGSGVRGAEVDSPDGASVLVLDSSGNVYVAGFTNSSDFPGVGPGSADSTLAGLKLGEGAEGFVAKLNSDLSSILAATFLGGSSFEFVNALALDSTGNVYVAGRTFSSDFPGISPASADSTAAFDEGFVAKLNSDLSSILAATFLGGSGLDFVNALALDSTGNVYVAGFTGSADFPSVGPGSADSIFGEPSEGFAVKLNSDLSSILAATFLGGGNSDNATALAFDSTGNVYVAGDTRFADFPGIGPGSADSTSGFVEGFVAKLDPNLSSGLRIVDDKVNFVVSKTSFNPASVPGGPAGTFTISAVLTNRSAEIIGEPVQAVVKTLSNGNKLLSATEGDGGVGSKQAIDAGADDILMPGESSTVEFRIGLANHDRFDFFVDVLGVVSDGE